MYNKHGHHASQCRWESILWLYRAHFLNVFRNEHTVLSHTAYMNAWSWSLLRQMTSAHFMCIPLYPWLQTPTRTTSLWALTINTFFLKFKVTFFPSLLLWIFLSLCCCLCSLELKKNHCSVKWHVNKNSFCISDKLNSYKKLEPVLRENFTISLPYNLNTSFILQ